MKGLSLLRAVVAVISIVGGLGTPAGAESDSFQLTDIAQDANRLTDCVVVPPAGQPCPIGDGKAAPGSIDAADIQVVRMETTYQAVPVGGDGVDYRATGLVVRVVTQATPAPLSERSSLRFYVVGDVGGCSSVLMAHLRGPNAPSATAVDRSVWWYQRAGTSRPCPDATVTSGAKSVTNPGWMVSVDTAAHEIAWAIPFSSLTTAQAAYLREGASVGPGDGCCPAVSGLSAWSADWVIEGQTAGSFLGGGAIDRTPYGPNFVVGSDMPHDIPCTFDCA